MKIFIILFLIGAALIFTFSLARMASISDAKAEKIMENMKNNEKAVK